MQREEIVGRQAGHACYDQQYHAFDSAAFEGPGPGMSRGPLG